MTSESSWTFGDAVEATAGKVGPAALASKMANTINQNKGLQATYLPHNTALVLIADNARTAGRRRLRGTNRVQQLKRTGRES